jgi:hypothetical protein
MNKRHFFSMIALTTVIVIVFIAAMKTPDNAAFITHVVKKGETVSLVCIDIYGYYSNKLGAAFAKDNPAVKNINLIHIGQKLQFRKPITDTTTTATVKDTASVFYQRVNATQGVVTYIEGSAKLTKQGSATPAKLTANVVVYPGDMIKTGADGRVELIINREAVVRMKENTELTIDVYRDMKKDEGKTALNFSLGSVWSKLKKSKDDVSRFELEMPTAIAGVHGTVYQTTVGSDKSAEVKVYDGEVKVSGKPPQAPSQTTQVQEVKGPHEVPGPRVVSMEEWVRIVRAMQLIKINSQGMPSDATAFQKSPTDSWENWNEERDKRIAEMFKEQ